MKKKRSLLWIAGLMIIAGHSAAEVYKWVDEDGQVHYGDKPRDQATEMQVKSVKTETPPQDDQQDRLERQQRLLNAMQQERQTKQEARSQAEAEQKETREKCARARQQLEQYRNAQFLYRKPQGELSESDILSNEEREKATQELAAQIAKHCK